MSKIMNSLVPSVQYLVASLGVKVMTHTEYLENPEYLGDSLEHPENWAAFYNPVLDVVVVNDTELANATELVLHEIIHWSGAETRLNRQWVTSMKAAMLGDQSEELLEYLTDKRDTEEATAQIGMLKLALVLGLNPAQYAESTLTYLEDLLDFSLKKAEEDSDKAVEYLVTRIGMQKVA